MSGRSRRPGASPPRSQHFLGPSSVAAEIARAAGLGPGDLVVEFGAGHGRRTEQLAARAGRVIAIELDRRLADRLAHRLRERSNVVVVEGDALAVPLPKGPFRVVCNPPFHITSALLHRLLDDRRVQLLRADLVLQWGAALALTGVFGPAHKARPWQDRYEFLLLRRLPAGLFQPRPSWDAALVSIRARPGTRTG